MAATRWCPRCESELPLGEFGVSRSKASGVQAHCRTCRKAIQAAYRMANREALRLKSREYSARTWRQRYEANRDDVQASQKAYRQRHPEIARAHWAAARARVQGATEVHQVLALVVLEREDGRCGVCGGDVDPFDFTLDHILPLKRGGQHTYENVQLAHRGCNAIKGDAVSEMV